MMKNIHPVLKSIINILVALVLALLFRSVIYEPFHIPSGSMKSTLLIGDYIFVSKYSYGYSHFSFPLPWKVFSGRILYHPPKRGDVVVFRPTQTPNVNYIKRVIGLPGDDIQIRHGILYINNKPVQHKKTIDFADNNYYNHKVAIPRYIETLPNGKSYSILQTSPDGAVENTPIYHVPMHHFLVLGDNRDASRDSRFIGFIPEENLVGKAQVVVFSVNTYKHFSVLPFSLRMNRFWHYIN